MLTLITRCDIYTPEFAGKKDVLIGGGKILAVMDQWKDEMISGSDRALNILHVDGAGLRMVPGLIDSHVHVAGAGGEGGPATRTGEIPLGELLEGGVTSVVGCLGTDGITRDVTSVLMKTKALREEGLSAWMYSGAYQVPPPTITGDPARDVALIEEVIGVGEIALSDHRSSGPSIRELIRLASEVRIAGMLSGKAGILNIHLGDAPNPFGPLLQATSRSQLPLKQFYPTHCNRNREIFEASKKYGKKGYLDLTTSSYAYFQDAEIKPSRAVRLLLEAAVPLEHITLSSDANGSLPAFDKDGQLLHLERGKPSATLHELKDMVEEEGLPMEQAVQTVATNVARILKLKNKGRIEPGYDADLLLINSDYEISHLFAMGKLMTEDYQVTRKGYYEG